MLEQRTRIEVLKSLTNFRIEGYGFMNQCTHGEDVCEEKNDYDGLVSRLANTFPNLRELDISRSKFDTRLNSIQELQMDLPNCQVISNLSNN